MVNCIVPHLHNAAIVQHAQEVSVYYLFAWSCSFKPLNIEDEHGRGSGRHLDRPEARTDHRNTAVDFVTSN